MFQNKLFEKKLAEAASHYAPKKQAEKLPASELDQYSLKIKVTVIGICIAVECVAYAILIWYYDGTMSNNCKTHYGASTCSYAIDKVRELSCLVDRYGEKRRRKR